MTTRRTTTKPPVHLRIRTENFIGGATHLVSICGTRLLENSINRLQISKSANRVTCVKCLSLTRKPPVAEEVKSAK